MVYLGKGGRTGFFDIMLEFFFQQFSDPFPSFHIWYFWITCIYFSQIIKVVLGATNDDADYPQARHLRIWRRPGGRLNYAAFGRARGRCKRTRWEPLDALASGVVPGED